MKNEAEQRKKRRKSWGGSCLCNFMCFVI